MAKLVEALIPIFLLLAAAATMARSQTTSFSYNFFGERPTDLLKQGHAHFPSETTFLRLTDPQPNQVGRAIHVRPIQFWLDGSQVDFQTTVNFIIRPGAGGLPADGIAFFIAPVGSTIPDGSTGPNLGLFDDGGISPGVFAVQFAAYINGSETGPDYPNVAINIGTATPSNKTVVGDAIIGQLVNSQISYVAETKKIHVIVTAGLQIFEVSYVYDLSKLVEQEVQVGLSASTGEYVARNDIVSWYFYADMNSGAVNRRCVM